MQFSLRPKHILLWGIATVLVACSSEPEKTAPALPDAPTHTLVFLDKTQSVNVNKSYVNEKYRQVLAQIVEENMRNKGDKLEVYFIHENTSKARALSLTVRAEKEGIEHANATDREAIETAFQMALQREKGIYLRQALTKLNQQNSGGSNQWTDIWASMPIIAKATEGGSDVKVYYFSDMVESVQGTERRNFHSNPPATDAQAEEWAKADAKQLEQHAIGSPQVTVITPFEPTASTRENSPHVTHYWEILFQELGGVSIEEL
ncbi:hypothetical protein [Telluribacter sp.]|uniref:hypothetical protein n=1 Tax=Telluribacter sp. TaxID=1978767 RepID=UPI002E125446|nr:hypothetical protein [Telluribacter sp.]